MNEKHNDLTEILSQALNEMKTEFGNRFDLQHINLAELERRTGISRGKLRRLQADGFVDRPHARTGKTSDHSVLDGFSGIIDDLLRRNVKNSSVIFERLSENGYQGGLTSVKYYIQKHKDLLPAKRQIVSPQGNRGRRYESAPGEIYQMDWGFVNVESARGDNYKIACFAMICHACGRRYIEFFPNAKQECLFIGMIHAFMDMGIPKKVLTDNMKSVVVGRDSEGHPIWQKDYELFMGNIGFETKLCKPRHPFTKGAVERLVRYVKDNFIAGRLFNELTDLNFEAVNWCRRMDSIYHKAVDCVPKEKHAACCMKNASELEQSPELAFYLCPERKISFDGFINYEGRRFGVPYWYGGHSCRVQRDGYQLIIYSLDMRRVLVKHDVTWGKRDSYCSDQFAREQPEELPSMPVKVHMHQSNTPKNDSGFDRFNFEEGLSDE